MAFPPGTKLLQEDGVTIIPRRTVMAEMQSLKEALKEQPALAFTPAERKPCKMACGVTDSSTSTSHAESPNPTPQPKHDESTFNSSNASLSSLSSSSDDDTQKPRRPPLANINRAAEAVYNTPLPLDLPAPSETNATKTVVSLPPPSAKPLLKDVKPEKPAAIKLKPDEIFNHGRIRKKMPHEMPFSPIKSEADHTKPKAVKRKAPAALLPPPKRNGPQKGLFKPDASHWGDFKIPKKH
uniref:Uncharacterized protein n=1 Tax=Panagrellus redivivus TaxID=6233 RepID=A0A7E4ZTF5_PANRE